MGSLQPSQSSNYDYWPGDHVDRDKSPIFKFFDKERTHRCRLCGWNWRDWIDGNVRFSSHIDTCSAIYMYRRLIDVKNLSPQAAYGQVVLFVATPLPWNDLMVDDDEKSDASER